QDHHQPFVAGMATADGSLTGAVADGATGEVSINTTTPITVGDEWAVTLAVAGSLSGGFVNGTSGPKTYARAVIHLAYISGSSVHPDDTWQITINPNT